MYCSKCGGAIEQNEAICGKCGQPAGAPLPTVAPEAPQLSGFDRTVRRLGKFWYLFAGLSAVLATMGLFMVQTGQTGMPGPWEPWPHPPIWAWTLTGSAAWTLTLARFVFAVAAAWGLQNRADWGRVVAFLAGAFALTDFPIGAVLGVYTIAAMIGRRRGELYRQPVRP